MEVSFRWTTLPPTVCRRGSGGSRCQPAAHIMRRIQNNNRRSRRSTIQVVPTAIDSAAQVDLSWEIIVGALAGVTSFVVAGIEFSKRIVAQRRCGVCRGSGLVKRDKYYFRCPRCGGFLPWQSWKRFFQVK